MKVTPLKTLTHCLSSKQHRVSFHSNGPHKRSNILNLLHIYVLMMDGKYLGGATYFFTFSKDYSRKVWAFVLKFKNHVLRIFKHFYASIKREKRRKLKCVRVDNGDEYTGPFKGYCKEHGIKFEKIVPKTHQHNGVSKRMNPMINDKI